MESQRFDPYNLPCACGKGFVRIIRSETCKNPDRLFAKCPLEDNGCNFWCWVDEIRMCKCDKGLCRLLTSHTDRSNGKKFYVCPKSSKDPKKNAESCSYFTWKEDGCETSIKFKDVVEYTASKNAEGDCEVGSSKKTKKEERPMDKWSIEKVSRIRLKLEVEARASKRFSEFCENMLEQLDDIEKEID